LAVEERELVVELGVSAFEGFGLLEKHLCDDGEELGRARRAVRIDVALAVLVDVLDEVREAFAEYTRRGVETVAASQRDQ
jgi:hypothetical protein